MRAGPCVAGPLYRCSMSVKAAAQMTAAGTGRRRQRVDGHYRVRYDRDLPVEVRYQGHRGVVRERAAVHGPELVLTGKRVAPHDVGLAVAVEVAHCRDLAVEVRRGEEWPGDERGAVHEPDRVLPGCPVTPQDVGLAVAVEVAHSHDLPVQVRYQGD